MSCRCHACTLGLRPATKHVLPPHTCCRSPLLCTQSAVPLARRLLGTLPAPRPTSMFPNTFLPPARTGTGRHALRVLRFPHVTESMLPWCVNGVQVSQVEVIDSEEGEPGSSSMGTMLGAAGGMAAAGGLAAAAALGAPLAAAAAAVGAVVGAFAGGAVGKEVPRGVDIDSAMEFDQPHVVAAGQEQERQESVDEVVLGGKQDDEVAGRSGGQLGQHEIADVKKEKK